MASDLNNSPSGANITEQTVTTTGANLGNTLEQQYSTDILGLSEVGDLLVSDWTKLQDAAQNAGDTANAAADWSWNTRQATLASNQLVLAARRQAYRTLFPLAYPLWRVSAGTVPGSTDNGLKNYACWSYKFSPGNFPFNNDATNIRRVPRRRCDRERDRAVAVRHEQHRPTPGVPEEHQSGRLPDADDPERPVRFPGRHLPERQPAVLRASSGSRSKPPATARCTSSPSPITCRRTSIRTRTCRGASTR